MPRGPIPPVMTPTLAPRPGRAVLRIAGTLTQLLCAGCLLLGTIAFVLVQQNKTGGTGLVIAWASAALVALVLGGFVARGAVICAIAAGALDAAFGIALLAIDYDTLDAILALLPESDVAMIADIVTVFGALLLGAAALCLAAIPQAIRYARWARSEPASSTARGFPPPAIAAPRGSVWHLSSVAPDESRPRRGMYIALAGFAIGLGAGVGVLVSSTQRSRAPATPEPRIATPIAPIAPKVPPRTGSVTPPIVDDEGGSAVQTDAPDAAKRAPIATLIRAQLAALEQGDAAALAAHLAPNAFGFGTHAASAAEGRAALEAQLRKDLGELGQGTATVRFQQIGEADNHAWIALDLELAAGGDARRFAVTQLAAWVGGKWLVVAWHWAVPVQDAAAERMMVLGTKPQPAPIASALSGPKDLDEAVRAAYASREGFVAARSEHPRGFNFGSGPNERLVGGATVKRVFNRLSAELRLHDGAHIVGAGAWDPAQQAAPTVAFAAANVDFVTKTRAATELTQTFRVLTILLKEDGAWKIVQTQWSHGGPIR